MTLALLLTAVTGAMATTDPNSVYWNDQTTWSGWTDSETTHTVGDITITCSGNAKAYEIMFSGEPLALQAGANDAITFTSNGKPFASIKINMYDNTDPGLAGWTWDNGYNVEWSGTPSTSVTLSGCDIKADNITFTFATAPAITVEPGSSANTWTFAMPGSDVVLTPRYAAATLYENDGETEKQAYETLKEAFANVQDGDVIKLDWDVTLTEDLATPTRDGGVKFTIDFNGYTLDAGTYLYLANAGDELTFTDTSGKDKLGGLKCIGTNAVENAKYIFDSGRYKFGKYSTAESMNALYATTDAYGFADGKEFVDIANGPDADDFNLTVDYKSFELTIGAGRFDTFFADQNVALDAETPAGVGLYTITLIEEDSETGEPTVAYLGKLTGVVEKETPMLVYNGTDAQQTVKIKVTPDEADAENESISPLENFMGTAVAKTFTEDDMTAADYYALSGGKLFVPVYDAGTIGKNQCWLQFNHANGAPARGITLVFEKEEATGVNEVSEVNEAGDGAWYDLSGRKLNAAPIKGVYIKDGKKIVK